MMTTARAVDLRPNQSVDGVQGFGGRDRGTTLALLQVVFDALVRLARPCMTWAVVGTWSDCYSVSQICRGIESMVRGSTKVQKSRIAPTPNCRHHLASMWLCSRHATPHCPSQQGTCLVSFPPLIACRIQIPTTFFFDPITLDSSAKSDNCYPPFPP